MKRIVVCCALVVWFGVVSAATYEETFTPKAGKAYSEDINVWVYTPEFADRFGMPKEWIDDELKGAYAVAFRVEYVSGRLMFPHKGPDVSMPTERCILDVYVPSDAPIPWRDGQVADFWVMTPSSPTYVLPQSKEDRVWRQRPAGIESPGKKARRPVIRLDEGTLFVREYDKELYPGVMYMSFNMGCMEPPKRAVLVEFCADESWEGSRCHALHEIHIPDAYMQKLHGQWYEKTGKGATKQWREIIGK